MALQRVMTKLAQLKQARVSAKHSNHVNGMSRMASKKAPLVHTQICQSNEIISDLTRAFTKHHTVRIFIKDMNTQNYVTLNTTILGFDIQTNEILLDTPCPLDYHALVHVKENNASLTIELPTTRTDGSKLHLTGILDALLNIAESPCSLGVKVAQAGYTKNKRLYPRAHFSSLSAPTAFVQAKGKPSIKMQLADVSRFGAKLLFNGQDIRDELASSAVSTQDQPNHVDIKIVFNDHFTMQLHAKVVQAKYTRTPHCHNQVRLAFISPSPVEQSQIDELIFFLENSDLIQVA